jgi:putative membrane protein
VGIARVIYGAKGYLYYIENVWFWAKMASFAAIGLLSIPPTLRFFAWRKAAAATPDFVPVPAEIASARFLRSLGSSPACCCRRVRGDHGALREHLSAAPKG